MYAKSVKIKQYKLFEFFFQNLKCPKFYFFKIDFAGRAQSGPLIVPKTKKSLFCTLQNKQQTQFKYDQIILKSSRLSFRSFLVPSSVTKLVFFENF